MGRQPHQFRLAAMLTLALLLLGCSRKGPEWNNEGIESIQLGQRGTVYSLAFSPDGKYLAVSSKVRDKGFVVWDVESQTEVFSAEGRIKAIAFSPDGKILAVEGVEKAAGLKRPTIFSPDGETIELVDPFTLWDTTAWTEKMRPAITDIEAELLAFHPKEDLLFVAGKQLLLWDLKAGKARYRIEPHKFWIRGFALSPDGRTLVTGADTGKVWEAVTGKELWSFGAPPSTDSVSCAAFLPDGGTFATGGIDGKVRLWDLKAKKEKAVFSGELYRCGALAVSGDGKLIVVAGGSLADDPGLVEFWEVSTGKRLAKLNVPNVIHVALSPDGKWLATGTSDGLKKGGPNEPGVVELWKMAEVLGKKSK